MGIVLILWIILKIICIVVPLLIAVAYLTYAERRVIGFMQARVGPNRVGPFGLFQPFADVIKLIHKEIIVPEKSNRFFVSHCADHQFGNSTRLMGGDSL